MFAGALVDDEAVDVSRMTDLPWGWWKIEQRGELRPVLLLDELGWWDRFRVFWTRLGGWYYLDCDDSKPQDVNHGTADLLAGCNGVGNLCGSESQTVSI